MSSAGCFIGALVARTSDYVPLCIYTDENYNSTNNVFRQQAQRILERMETPAGGANRAEARGSYYQSYNHKDSIYFAFQDAATNLTIIAALNKLLLRNSGDLNGINRLGCGLLDAIFAEFTQNNDPNEYLAESVRPFQFQKFDGVIQRCMSKVHQAEMSGGSAVGGNRRQVNPNYDVLKQELTDVHLVMRKNLEDLMTRGERLEKINSYSDQLVDQSNKYYKKTVHINRMRLVKINTDVVDRSVAIRGHALSCIKA